MDSDDQTLPERRGGPPAVRGESPAQRDASPARRRPFAEDWRGGSPFLTALFALAVAIAFADSSIVVLALPELYLDFDTSIQGISWVITSYNLVLAVAALAFVPLVRRAPRWAAPAGLAVFCVASVGCALSGELSTLVIARSVQGLGAALFLAVSLTVLVGLAGSVRAGLAVWTAAGAFGVAIGPALGGVLTEVFDWQAIFVFQAPIAGAALVAVLDARVRSVPLGAEHPPRRGLLAANLGLVALFAALVGALFLAVILVVTVWDFGPLAGAAVVSALPLAAIVVRPVASRLPVVVDCVAGSLLLAAGLAALALLPDASGVYAALALAVCGAGFGLAVPSLSGASINGGADLPWSGSMSVASRHAGLVVGLLVIAPLLAADLEEGAQRATENATAAILDAPLPLDAKIPIALDLRDEFARVPEGEVPDLARPFDENGAADDPAVAAARDDLLGTIEAALTRSFRRSFAVAALLALLTVVPAVFVRRRTVA